MKRVIDEILEDYVKCTDHCENCKAFESLNGDWRNGNYCNLLTEHKEKLLNALREAVERM